ncbi:MAG: hypothetical protein WD425_07440 [Nitrospirales bacterium]
METMPTRIRSWQTVLVCMGCLLATGVSMTPSGAQDNQNVVSSESRAHQSQKSAPATTPALPSTNDTTDSSVIIGDGIRTPPDIGVAGTSSPTPPLRFESPTDQSDIFPETTPVTPDSSATPDGFPSAEPAPLETPELFKD